MYSIRYYNKDLKRRDTGYYPDTPLTLNHTIQKTVSGVNRYMEGWKRHQFLWKQDKVSILDKFVAKVPTVEEFEEKLSKYTKMSEDIWATPKDKVRRCKLTSA